MPNSETDTNLPAVVAHERLMGAPDQSEGCNDQYLDAMLDKLPSTCRLYWLNEVAGI
jgi:hypothetical protein